MISFEKQKIVIISDNLIIFDALNDNTEYYIKSIDSNYLNFIDSISKVDLLIIDKDVIINEIPFYRINSLINLTNKRVHPKEINLHKPFRLSDLLQVISREVQDEYLFCCINNSWIYHQREARLRSSNNEILFTDKENNLFLELLISEDFSANKDFLKNRVWKYHKNTETTTVETHLYKLKQKLPSGLLKINSLQCQLVIDSIS